MKIEIKGISMVFNLCFVFFSAMYTSIAKGVEKDINPLIQYSVSNIKLRPELSFLAIGSPQILKMQPYERYPWERGC
jgi:hypothetical protein